MKLLIFLIFLMNYVYSWNNWDYKTQWWVNGGSAERIEEEVALRRTLFYSVWSNQTLPGATHDVPRPRRGHTMVISGTPDIAPFYGHSYIIMFGGRDNENVTDHIPKTYNIQKVCLLYINIL